MAGVPLAAAKIKVLVFGGFLPSNEIQFCGSVGYLVSTDCVEETGKERQAVPVEGVGEAAQPGVAALPRAAVN